jgi:ribose transport system ATP-binding protein
MASDLLLRCRGVNKRYPGVHALKDFDFDVRRGEVHALVGENGAGKSTFLKILSGAEHPDEGTVEFDDRDLTALAVKSSKYDTHRAINMGIAMVYQELALVPELTVAENILLGNTAYRLQFARVVDWKGTRARAQELVNAFGLEIDVNRRVGDLGIGTQQLVEILRAVSRDVKLLLLDEPTSALSRDEIDILFNRVIARMRERGVSVIYISHRLEEVFQIADRVTVLRDGELISTEETGQTNADRLISHMVGREIKQRYVKNEAEIGQVVFSAEGIAAKDLVHDCSINVRRGEIVGLAGLMGAGRTELAKTIVGLYSKDAGTIRVNDRDVTVNTPKDALKHGIAYLSESRFEGLIHTMGVAPNITISNLAEIFRTGVLDRTREDQVGQEYVRRLQIDTPSVRQHVRLLSGGNQQKVALARWIYCNSDVFILDEPTRGIDVGAKIEVYELIGTLLQNGKAVILISSELPEVVSLSDRVVVMYRGTTVAEYSGSDINPETIMRSATGREVTHGIR